MKRGGLQRLHQHLQEASRLWKRYLIENPVFEFLLALQILGLTKYGSMYCIRLESRHLRIGGIDFTLNLDSFRDV